MTATGSTPRIRIKISSTRGRRIFLAKVRNNILSDECDERADFMR
jgi:hypothetical protein